MKRYIVLLMCIIPFTHLAAVQKASVAGVTYRKSVFFHGIEELDKPALIVGISKEIKNADKPVTSPAGTFAIARGVLGASDKSVTAFGMQPLAPQTVVLNGQKDQQNRLNGEQAKKIIALSLFDEKYPVVVPASTEVDPKGDKVYLMTDFIKGGILLENSEEIKDANKQTVDRIVDLVASSSHIFVTVAQSQKQFTGTKTDGTDRGVALLVKGGSSEEGLKVLDVDNFASATPQARRISLNPEDRMVAFTNGISDGKPIESAEITSPDVAMWWDKDLERLYVGLTVKREDDTKEGGVIPLLMGYIEPEANLNKGGKFELSSVVFEPEKKLFYDVANGANVKTRMIGIYLDPAKPNGQDPCQISIPFVRTMHTSTDKFYIIVDSNITGGTIKPPGPFGFTGAVNNIYALPLTPNNANNSAMSKGVIARVKASGIPDLNMGQYQLPDSFDNMPDVTHQPVQVGGARQPSVDGISDLFVAGDSVYTTFDGMKSSEKGIFRSTALFNKDGLVLGWTPFDRMMGQDAPVAGAGLDVTSGNFYFLYDQTLSTSLAVTQWGLGDPELHGDNPSQMLSSVVNSFFCSCHEGGAHQIFNFDEFTPGFMKQCFSMMVVLGLDQVELIQTMRGALPVTEFRIGDNVFVVKQDVLATVGPLCSAAVVRNTASPLKGYLYVGGFGGIARLGPWPAVGLVNLSSGTGNFPGTNQFQQRLASQITGPVLGLATGLDSLYVLTPSKVFKVTVNELTPDVIAAQTSATIKNGSDILVIRDTTATPNPVDIIVVASSNGIQIFDSNLTLKTTVPGIAGHVVQMQYLSREQLNDNVPTIPGNIYALVLGEKIVDAVPVQEVSNACCSTGTCSVCSSDCSTQPCKKTCIEKADCGEQCAPQQQPRVSQVFRVAVEKIGNNSKIEVNVIDKDKQGQLRPYLQFNDRRSSITTDGSILFATHPKELLDFCDFVRLSEIVTFTASSVILETEQSITNQLAIDDCKEYNVGIIKQNSATGSWVVPGSWGVRVNE